MKPFAAVLAALRRLSRRLAGGLVRPRCPLGFGATLVALTLMAVPGGRATEPAEVPLRAAKLRLLFASSLIQNVNRADVLAAFRLWVETVGRNRGFKLETETAGYDSLEEVAKRLRENMVDLVIFTTTDYLQFAEGSPLQPVFSPTRNEKAEFDEYVLLTRRDRNLAELAALRGRSVAFFRYGGDLGRRWLEVSLGERGLGSIDDFFGSRSDFSKASSVVLPVFFGKIDAAVVNEPGWATMQEMNPQLTREIQVIARSPRMGQSVICLHQNYTDLRAEVLEGLAGLHQEPRGQQILLVFKIGRLLPFKPEYLDSVREIEARRARLLQAPGRTGAGRTGGGESK